MVQSENLRDHLSAAIAQIGVAVVCVCTACSRPRAVDLLHAATLQFGVGFGQDFVKPLGFNHCKPLQANHR